jgi:hypothetical protein
MPHIIAYRKRLPEEPLYWGDVGRYLAASALDPLATLVRQPVLDGGTAALAGLAGVDALDQALALDAQGIDREMLISEAVAVSASYRADRAGRMRTARLLLRVRTCLGI